MWPIKSIKCRTHYPILSVVQEMWNENELEKTQLLQYKEIEEECKHAWKM